MYFLDTNVIIDIIRGKHPALKRHFINTKRTEIAIPSIVVAELEYGARHSDNYEDNRRKFMNIIKNFEILPFTNKEAEFYGYIRQTLTSQGKIIGPNDLFIAAMALSTDATLITHNTDEFNRIPDLKIEDWTI